MNQFKIIILCILCVLVLAACDANLQDGDEQITEEIDEVISNYIIEKYSSSFYDTEKQFEVHKVYGTSESGGILTVYMWSYFGGFNKSTGLELQSGHSLPAVIKLREKDGNFSVIKYTEPQDGSLYLSSLKKMFPKKYVVYAQLDSGNIGGLQKEMDEKVSQWLKSQE